MGVQNEWMYKPLPFFLSSAGYGMFVHTSTPVTFDNIIWARSAWAGSQRYPLHWGGDAENTDSAMAAELRGGLSFGLSGVTFWSHDVGGFVQRAPRDLYRRWLAWGVLTAYTRAHGAPPREPGEYDEALTDSAPHPLLRAFISH